VVTCAKQRQSNLAIVPVRQTGKRLFRLTAREVAGRPGLRGGGGYRASEDGRAWVRAAEGVHRRQVLETTAGHMGAMLQ